MWIFARWRDGFWKMITSPKYAFWFQTLWRTEFSKSVFNSSFRAKIFTQIQLKLNMSEYPNLSQRQYRMCSYKEEIVCPTFPCVHFECHDPDYLADYEEFLANNEVYWKSWDLYNSLYGKTPSSTLKEQLSAEDWAFYEPKVDRCRRLKEKREQIRQEVRAYGIRRRAQHRKEWEELLNDESTKDHPYIIMRKRDLKRGSLQTKLWGAGFGIRICVWMSSLQ